MSTTIFTPLLNPTRTAAAEPNGCAICSLSKREHPLVWHGNGLGFQPWQEPTNKLRKERMLLARSDRDA